MKSVDSGGIEDLVGEVLIAYRGVAVSLGKLESEDPNAELATEARNICQRLEAIMALLDEEMIDPELDPEELLDSVQSLIAEARTLEGRLKALITIFQSRGR